MTILWVQFIKTLGESMILGSLSLLAYGALIWLTFHIFVLAYEEPTLRRTFGAEYDAFRANVPRRVPRFSPWSGSTKRRLRSFYTGISRKIRINAR
jgi:protein-S-isoprenylcysteine O-methyltransferase Ste14